MTYLTESLLKKNLEWQLLNSYTRNPTGRKKCSDGVKVIFFSLVDVSYHLKRQTKFVFVYPTGNRKFYYKMSILHQLFFTDQVRSLKGGNICSHVCPSVHGERERVFCCPVLSSGADRRGVHPVLVLPVGRGTLTRRSYPPFPQLGLVYHGKDGRPW